MITNALTIDLDYYKCMWEMLSRPVVSEYDWPILPSVRQSSYIALVFIENISLFHFGWETCILFPELWLH